jgi:hypothetical protein
MATAYQTALVRRDSGVDTVDYIKTSEPPERAAVRGGVTNDSTVDRVYYNSNITAMKRTLSDASSGWFREAKYTAKKGRYNEINEKIISSTTQVRRVLCPFYIKRPNMDEHKASCYLTGFKEMARLKQHLVDEHKVPSEDLSYFRNKSFIHLGTLEAKWRRVFHTIFPNIVEEDVPSPCKSERADTLHRYTYRYVDKSAVPYFGLSTTLSASPPTALSPPENITSPDDCKPLISTVYDPLQTSKSSKGQNSGLPTPPSSAETSPELSNLATTPDLEYESLFPSPATTELPINNFVDLYGCELPHRDPLLFPDHSPRLLFSCDLAITTPVANATTHAAQSFVWPTACLSCGSADIRQSWSREGPFIWICHDCACTDMGWSGVLVGECLPAEDASKTIDALAAVEADIRMDIDEWGYKGDCGDWVFEDIEKMYSDEFFDFGELDELFKI